MQSASSVTIGSDDERKAAIARAAVLMGCISGSEEEREFDALTDAIAEYDMRNVAQGRGLVATAPIDAGEFEQSTAHNEARHLQLRSRTAASADAIPISDMNSSIKGG